MRPTVWCIIWFTVVACAAASEMSPSRQFTVISTDTAIQLIALPSRQLIVPDIFEAGRPPSVLWSNDSTRFACYQSQGRFSMCRAFQRRGDAFVELTLPRLTLPFAATIEPRVTKWVGQHDTPSRWIGTSLVITITGEVNLVDDTSIDYAYEFTVAFAKDRKGKVTKIKKKRYRRVSTR